jgi:hypothetical protein
MHISPPPTQRKQKQKPNLRGLMELWLRVPDTHPPTIINTTSSHIFYECLNESTEVHPVEHGNLGWQFRGGREHTACGTPFPWLERPLCQLYSISLVGVSSKPEALTVGKRYPGGPRSPHHCHGHVQSFLLENSADHIGLESSLGSCL